MNIVTRSWKWTALQWYNWLEKQRIGKWHWTRPKPGEWGYVDPAGIDNDAKEKEKGQVK